MAWAFYTIFFDLVKYEWNFGFYGRTYVLLPKLDSWAYISYLLFGLYRLLYFTIQNTYTSRAMKVFMNEPWNELFRAENICEEKHS